MTLFDDIARPDQRPKRENEPLFDYYNTSGRRAVDMLRMTLETWFQRVAESAKPDLCARFRNRKDAHHQGAFFELYLHEILCSMGFQVVPHPDISGNDGKHPDYLVLQGGERRFYLEATLASSSENEAAQGRLVAQVYDTLNQMKSPNFFLAIRVREAPASAPPGAPLRRDLERWLSGLDPDALQARRASGGLDALPSHDWSRDGWELSFLPVPKSAALRGQQGVRPIGMTWSEEWKSVNSHTALKKRIGDKATKYGQLELPFVVAVNVIDDVDKVTIMDALFGEENVTLAERSDGSIVEREGRHRNGVWYGPQGPQNTRVSAALISVDLTVWTMAARSPTMIHNPWASRPFPQELWSLPQVIPYATGQHQEHRAGSAAAGVVLGLPTPWPPSDKKGTE